MKNNNNNHNSNYKRSFIGKDEADFDLLVGMLDIADLEMFDWKQYPSLWMVDQGKLFSLNLKCKDKGDKVRGNYRPNTSIIFSQ